MSDQSQQIHNQDMGSVELTHGYDMDGHANMASALQVSFKREKKPRKFLSARRALLCFLFSCSSQIF